ncbi:MAG: 16S rRNA pseudouridine(516) synthase [Aerococcaceae bacterium]|nr:16S rRNA pseudouridine(516) synthase [Aerococcaceae bacterium]
MRLDKLLYTTLSLTKKEVNSLYKRQLITVNGRIPHALKQNVDSHLQIIEVDGQRIFGEKQHYYMLNKPKGVVTANSDRQHPTIMDLIRPEDRHPDLYAIGRLDFNTEGLLLLTTNGPLSLRLLLPENHVAKTYAVTTLEPLEASDVAAFERGIIFHDGTVCQPASLTILGLHTAHITLSEGKFHQVRKMFLCVGKKVTHLKRLSFGNLTLDPTLESGAYRPLNVAELQKITDYLD